MGLHVIIIVLLAIRIPRTLLIRLPLAFAPLSNKRHHHHHQCAHNALLPDNAVSAPPPLGHETGTDTAAAPGSKRPAPDALCRVDTVPVIDIACTHEFCGNHRRDVIRNGQLRDSDVNKLLETTARTKTKVAPPTPFCRASCPPRGGFTPVNLKKFYKFFLVLQLFLVSGNFFACSTFSRLGQFFCVL